MEAKQNKRSNDGYWECGCHDYFIVCQKHKDGHEKFLDDLKEDSRMFRQWLKDKERERWLKDLDNT